MQGNTVMTEKETVDAQRKRLEELRANKAKREEAANLAAEALELAELELEEKHLKLGARGLDFEIVSSAKGCVVLRKPDFQTAAAFNAIEAAKRTETEILRFVQPSVVEPADPATFRALVMDHGGILWRCAGALLVMYEAKVEERRGKF